MKILEWLQSMEEELASHGPVAADTDSVHKQIEELKSFKESLNPKHFDIESLNQEASELIKDSPTDQAVIIKEPMIEVNQRWHNLLDSVSDRKNKLQNALLNLGQFQHAINELLSWLDRTDKMLDEIVPVYGDPKVIEIELAKHKILQNDVSAHQASVDSVNEAGKQVIIGEGGAQATSTREKLDELNSKWEEVLAKTRDRQFDLETALREAQTFHGELQDMLQRLGEIDGQLVTARPVGGLPETAKEQLERFNGLFEELETYEPKVQELLESGKALLERVSDASSKSMEQNLQTLQQRWDNIMSRAKDKKQKLEEAQNKASGFHEKHNEFISWLTDTEKTLNNLKPVSRVLTTVAQQIEEHKVLQKDISSHREVMVALDKMGTHLKYFSQKQDVILIKNLLVSVQHRWEKVVSRSAERTRHLDHGCKEAKQFHEIWKELSDWLDENLRLIDADQAIGSNPDKIKQQISKHKEFQRGLGSKQPLYDAVMRMGRYLKEKAPKQDGPALTDMLNEVKNKWNMICGKSVDRQRKLEEALLFSGQFKEALQALLDWFYKMIPTLAEDQPLHGDLDTVNNLMEEHRQFQQELGQRAQSVSTVRKAARDLLEKSEEDKSHLENQLIELTTNYDQICKLSVNKQERLSSAHQDAEQFHKQTHMLLDWLVEAEHHLRYQGNLPDEEEEIVRLIVDHKKFQDSLAEQEGKLKTCLDLGQSILKHCHPDAVTTVKHWLTIIQARWEEISSWSAQRQKRLEESLSTLRDNASLLEDLMAWLTSAEATLVGLEGSIIPNNIPIIEQLIHDHQTFQTEMSHRQPDVEKLTKTGKRQQDSSHLPTPAHRGTRKRTAPTPKTDGKKTPEPTFTNPKVGMLFNKWRHVWLLAMERQRKLLDALDRLNELERLKNFDFDEWRRKYMRWMNHNKSRVMDFFRRQDKDHDGRITRKEFVDGILASNFPSTRLELEAVADIFDRDRDGFIDYKEFVAALRPDRESSKPMEDAERIQDEVKRQVSKCTCTRQFRIHKIGEGKYRFGESQKLRLVRILRSTVMVRVGGGWVALDEFLVKNDPCRAKGRTNIELREQFILAQGVSQSMAPFITKSPGSSSGTGSVASGTASWSSTGRTASSASGPIMKIREKTQYTRPWVQRSKVSPDTEVRQILSPSGLTRPTKPRNVTSPPSRLSITSPTYSSRPSSRASTSSRPASRPSSRQSSRPPSRTGSDVSDADAGDVFTTMQTETRMLAGRPVTTATYQTHVIKTRTLTTPPTQSARAVTSKIPKLTPSKKSDTATGGFSRGTPARRSTTRRRSDSDKSDRSETPSRWK